MSRSTEAHAEIKAIDVGKALKIPGVKALVTGRDFPDYLSGESIRDLPSLAVDKVRYVGEPVVAVAANDLLAAEKAIVQLRLDREQKLY